MAKANQGMNSLTQQMQGLSTEDRRGGRNNGRDNGQRGSRPNAGRQGQGQGKNIYFLRSKKVKDVDGSACLVFF